MTTLYILLGILGIILLFLFLPIGFSFEFKEQLSWRLSFCGITLLSSDNSQKADDTQDTELQKRDSEKKDDKKNPALAYFTNLKSQLGFEGAVKFCARLASALIQKLSYFIRRLRFKNFKLIISVASDDAAKTAVSYGAVCTAVYPVVSMLSALAKFKTKRVDITADFKSSNPEIEAALTVTAIPFVALLTAITAFFEYRKLMKESGLK